MCPKRVGISIQISIMCESMHQGGQHQLNHNQDLVSRQ